jgi:hypothetical protein
MKSIWIATAAVAATTLALTACKNRKEEPVPPPKATWAATPAPSIPIRVKTANAPARHDPSASGPHHGASGISWFQGTIEEAFSTSCAKCPGLGPEHPVVRPMSSLRH